MKTSLSNRIKNAQKTINNWLLMKKVKRQINSYELTDGNKLIMETLVQNGLHDMESPFQCYKTPTQEQKLDHAILTMEIVKRLYTLENVVSIQPFNKGPLGLKFNLDRTVPDNIKLLSSAHQASSRQLKCTYSLESQQDAISLHGPELKRVLANAMTKEISNEIILDVIKTLYDNCDASRTAICKDGNEIIEHIKEATIEYHKAYIPAPNFIICPSNVIHVISKMPEFEISLNPPPPDNMLNVYGTLQVDNQSIKVLSMETFSNEYSKTILLGYKGAISTDTGAGFFPYVLFKNTMIVNAETLAPQLSLISKYGTAIFNKNYFNAIQII